MCRAIGAFILREGKALPNYPVGIFAMDPEAMQTLAARDQLWASLRQLLPDINELAQGQFQGTDRERQLVQLIARIVARIRKRAAAPGRMRAIPPGPAGGCRSAR